MQTNELDGLCGRWSDNCTACTLATQTPHLGKLVPVRCQWVAGTSGACIALSTSTLGASSQDALELVRWIKRHQGTAGSSPDGHARRYDYARPVCRWLVRDHRNCAAQEHATSGPAKRCAGSSPTCSSCSAGGDVLCAFCAESKLGYADITAAPIRCVAAADHLTPALAVSSTFCTVPCEHHEELFDLSGESVLQGVVEYPLWRQHGLLYAQDQTCLWTIGIHRSSLNSEYQPGGFVSGSLAHVFAKYDALHISPAGRGHGQLPDVFGTESGEPLKLSKLDAPISVEFFSDSTKEASGFTLSWNFVPAASSGGAISPEESTAVGVDTRPDSAMSLEDIPFAAWVVAGVVSGVVLVLLICISCNYWQRYRRKFGEREAEKFYRESARITPNEMGKRMHPPQQSAPSAGSRQPPTMTSNASRQSKGARSSSSSSFSPVPPKQQTWEAKPKQQKWEVPPEPPPPPPRMPSAPPKAPPSNHVPPEAPSRRSQRGAQGAAEGSSAPQDREAGVGENRQSGPRGAARGSKGGSSNRRNSSASGSSGSPRRPSEADSAAGPKAPPAALPTSLLALPASLPAEAVAAMECVHQELIRGRALPETERKALLRELQRRWHPDKNPDTEKVVATTVFQHISAHSAWLLAGETRAAHR